MHEDNLGYALRKVHEGQTRNQRLASIDVRRGRKHGACRHHSGHVNDQHPRPRRNCGDLLVCELAVARRRLLLVCERQEIQALNGSDRQTYWRGRAVDRRQEHGEAEDRMWREMTRTLPQCCWGVLCVGSNSYVCRTPEDRGPKPVHVTTHETVLFRTHLPATARRTTVASPVTRCHGSQRPRSCPRSLTLLASLQS